MAKHRMPDVPGQHREDRLTTKDGKKKEHGHKLIAIDRKKLMEHKRKKDT